MNKKILQQTRYNPLKFEERIYKYWIPYFKPRNKGKKFIILIAPPNITGSLHLGHALQNIILDVIWRYKKMNGHDSIWIPGIDHAGIATQNIVEKELKKEGINRFVLGREKFIKRVWQWKEKYGYIILEQFKKLGLSLDWSRLKFTLDKQYIDCVEKAFIVYYKKGYIYRDLRPVNFCPRCKTSLSDLEIDYKETEGDLYYINYPLKEGTYLTVATTRPETMLGDIALAINPKDERYFHLIGKNAILPIIEKEIPIVVDSRVDPKFGTGILKITPAHSLIDYEIGIRHQLPMISVIDENAKMNENAYEFQGLDYLSAREKIVSKLKELGLIEKIEKIKHNLPFCDRCKSEIQVIPSKEWFLKMKNLADLALKAIKNKEVEIYPTRFKKVSFDWLKNIRDWCISRKLWWGQQIPVWYCKKCGEECFIVSQKKPKTKCLKCKKQNWQRTEEVFDTWFSSALWPFAILYTKYEKKFYPSDLVATAREILQLWIMRMIFSGKFFMGKEPFKFVFIHPTVLTKEGKRMSKSLGTGIDPLELIEKYGTDALRFGILWQMSAHQDLRFDLVPVEQGQKFLNKIWNAYRFYFLNKNLSGFKQDRISRFRSDKSGSYPGNLSGNYPGKSNKNPRLSSYDKKILRSLESTKKFVSKKIENYEMGLALKRIYKFFWNELCDVYLESWKGHPAPEHSTVRGSPESVLRSGSGRAKNNPEVFTKVMLDTLKLMHPFLPYITQFIYFNFKKGSNCLFFEKW